MTWTSWDQFRSGPCGKKAALQTACVRHCKRAHLERLIQLSQPSIQVRKGERTCRSLASFGDPDGNGWLLQEITTRLPGRIDSTTTNFASVSDLASALRGAEAAHGQHEKRIGQRDGNWPDWYAEYMVREQNGQELPQ